MKKTYISPDIDVVETETESLLTTSAETGTSNVWGNDDGTGEILAKEHHGIWEEWEEQ